MEISNVFQFYKEGSGHEKLLLALSALAFEPLSTEDIQAIAPREFPTIEESSTALKELLPILELSGKRLFFTTTRYKEAIFKNLEETDLVKNWEDVFIKFGEETLNWLQNSVIKPAETNPYVIRHYHKHLNRANAPREKIFALLDPSWAKACEWWGERKEYITITEKAFELAQKDPADLGILVRAILLKTSHAYVFPMPGKFLAAALKKKVISPEYAFSMIPDPEKHEFIFQDNLIELRTVLPEPFAGEVLKLIKKHEIITREEDDWIKPAPEIEVFSEEETRREFERLVQFEDKDDQHSGMCELFSHAHHKVIPDMIDFWIDNLTGWQYFPTDFIQRVPDELVDKLYALGMFFMRHGHPRVADNGVEVIFEILDRLNTDQLRTLIEEYRFTVLQQYKPTEHLDNLTRDEIQFILGDNEFSRRISKISEDLLQEITFFIPTRSHSAFPGFYSGNPVNYPEDNNPDEGLNVEAELEAVNKLENNWMKINKLTELAFKLPGTQREPVLDQAIQIVVKSERGREKYDFITKVAGILSEDQLNWALELASQIDHPMEGIGYEGWSQSALLATLSHRFSGDERQEIEQRAIEAVKRHTNYFIKAHIIGDLIRILTFSHYPTILEMASRIDNEWGDYATALQMSTVIRGNCARWDQLYKTRDRQYLALINILRIAKKNPSWVLMGSLKDLLPIIAQLGGEQAMAEAFVSAVEVNEWWP